MHTKCESIVPWTWSQEVWITQTSREWAIEASEENRMDFEIRAVATPQQANPPKRQNAFEALGHSRLYSQMTVCPSNTFAAVSSVNGFHSPCITSVHPLFQKTAVKDEGKSV